MSDKSQRLADLVAKVPAPATPFPAADGRSLLEIGFLCVLQRRLAVEEAGCGCAPLLVADVDAPVSELRSLSRLFVHPEPCTNAMPRSPSKIRRRVMRSTGSHVRTA